MDVSPIFWTQPDQSTLTTQPSPWMDPTHAHLSAGISPGNSISKAVTLSGRFVRTPVGKTEDVCWYPAG